MRRRKALGLVVALAIIVAISALDRVGGVLPVADDWHRYHGQTFDVARVVDGDTIDLRVPDGERAATRIRLWGVDTPELGRGGEPDEAWAKAARDYTSERVQGERITVYLQAHRLRGGFGRLLAYVELPDGRDLNAELIAAGLSPHDDRWGHDRVDTYEQAEQDARRKRRGLWSD